MKAWKFALIAFFCWGASAATVDLTGKVVDAQSGEGIPRARITVRLNQEGPPVELALWSEADGSFRLLNLPPGSLSLTADKAGYVVNSQGFFQAANAKPTPIVIRLTAQVVIDGTVVDERGAAVPYVQIQLVRPRVLNGRRGYDYAGSDSADETGHFRIFGLNAGRYYLAYSARVSGVRRAELWAYPPLFYPSSTDIAGAQLLDLKPGQEEEIRIRLPQALPARQIRGQIATPSANAWVQLRPAGSPLNPPSAYNMNVDLQSKTFKITGVTAGAYVLEANAQIESRQLRASLPVTVGNSDVTGIRLEPAAAMLQGTVRVEDADQAATPPPSLQFSEGHGPGMGPRTGAAPRVQFLSFQGARSGGGAQVEPDGTFRLSLSPGLYQITGPDSRLCARSMRQGSRDAWRDGLLVPEQGSPEPLDVAYTSHCGTVEGSLTLSDSSPPANLLVALLRKMGSELIMEKQTYLSAGNNRNPGAALPAGSMRFNFQGVTPGEYTVYAWPPDAQVEYAEPDFTRQFGSFGKAVTVTEDGRVTVTLDRVWQDTAKN